MARKTVESDDGVIIALCRDYTRRKSAICDGKLPRRVLMEYSYINKRIFEGAGEIVGGALCETFIEDIGNHTGYAASAVMNMSESTYKRYKAAAIKNIARKLHYSQ